MNEILEWKNVIKSLNKEYLGCFFETQFVMNLFLDGLSIPNKTVLLWPTNNQKPLINL